MRDMVPTCVHMSTCCFKRVAVGRTWRLSGEGAAGCAGGDHSREQVLVEVMAHEDAPGAATGTLRWQRKLPQDEMGLSRVCRSRKGN